MPSRITTNHTNDYPWTGRDDREDGDLRTRVHHAIRNISINDLSTQQAGIAILGFASDAGVARNKGRVGAGQAPDLIRSALANMAWHQCSPLYDLGTIRCEDNELESSQQSCGQVISQALEHASIVTLGGGHEIAWASFQGLASYLKTQHSEKPPKIGIINLDAHFDLRPFQSDVSNLRSVSIQPSSGTPFYQIADFCQKNGWPFHYACLGVSRASNTPALFKTAEDLGVWYIEDKSFTSLNQIYQLTQLQHFIDGCDYIYLTIDLDVFPAATAPGVSAPAARGVSIDMLAPFLERILHYKNKLVLADIAEYNPNFDIDNQTARLAARLTWDIVNAFSEKQ